MTDLGSLTSGGSVVQRHGRLGISGNRLIDTHGRTVVLRGVSLFWSQWGGQFFYREWLEWLRDHLGCDVVRAPLGVEPDGYLHHRHRETRKIVQAIEAAIELGIYIIVDWHAHTPHTEAAVAFFTKIAQRYPGCPNLIFESWNEPLAEHDWERDVVPHHLAVIDALRAAGAPNLVVCGTPANCRDFSGPLTAPLPRGDVCYALHFYCSSHRAGLREHARLAIESGVPVFVSEYGLSDSGGDGDIDVEEALRWWSFLEKHQISHVNWALNNKKEACSILKPKRLFLGNGRRLSKAGKLILKRHGNDILR